MVRALEVMVALLDTEVRDGLPDDGPGDAKRQRSPDVVGPAADVALLRAVTRRRLDDCERRSRRVVFDVGANFGQSSERYLADGYHVVAVEPNPAAAEAMRSRHRRHLDAGRLAVEEKAVWLHAELLAASAEASEASRGPKNCRLHVNEEYSEWSSIYEGCGRRYDTAAKEVIVQTTTLSDLYAAHGTPHYVKIDTEGADGVCLRQLRGLHLPPCVSFELHSLAWLAEAAALGYSGFKVVGQSDRKAEHLLDAHGRPLTHAGNFGEAATGICGDGGWRSLDDTLADCRRLCLVHDADADVAEFSEAPPHFVDRDFATLRACFPIESLDDEEWYDVHCRHAAAVMLGGGHGVAD